MYPPKSFIISFLCFSFITYCLSLSLSSNKQHPSLSNLNLPLPKSQPLKQQIYHLNNIIHIHYTIYRLKFGQILAGFCP
ncbi:hypothetical protein MRB53_035345 [Persea americana]|uniref:Uncharacterized protein n=1 Tax=Persea americana TaxID=3435 RepID=A0ACC2K4X3_PERAE|nr:hypothetical protein MRB53_035345 [Persea americana]